MHHHSPSPLFVGFIEYPVPSIRKRADDLLLFITERTSYAGEEVDWSKQLLEFFAVGWALNKQEFAFIVHILKDAKYIDSGVWKREARGGNTGRYILDSHVAITPLGWQKVQELRSVRGPSNQVFIACKFDDEVIKVVNEFFIPAVIKAGYAPLFLPNEDHISKIDDKIIAEIRKSKFIIADLTGHRQNVYYEAGFATGMGIPVVWTCEKSDLKNGHFDTRQYNNLDWLKDDTDALTERLKNRIEAVFGQGPVPPPK